MNKNIVGFTGFARSGKDTAADMLASYLVEQDLLVRRMSFAEPLKEMVQVGLGLAPDFDGEDREVPTWTGKSKREMYQTIGTEWGRELVHPDVWVQAAARRIERMDADVVIFSDVRFENEARWIQAVGGHALRVSRPGVGPVNDHVSDKGLADDLVGFDVINDTSLADLDAAIKMWAIDHVV